VSHFSKLLVARHSPKNECYADDGTVLYVKALTNVSLKNHLTHHFVSSTDHHTTSMYGWVAEVEAFTVDDFIRGFMYGLSVAETDRAHLEIMFRSIVKLTAGAPVAATYSPSGLGNKRMEFTVHRVVFYQE
jgi:hypothetical protein